MTDGGKKDFICLSVLFPRDHLSSSSRGVFVQSPSSTRLIRGRLAGRRTGRRGREGKETRRPLQIYGLSNIISEETQDLESCSYTGIFSFMPGSPGHSISIWTHCYCLFKNRKRELELLMQFVIFAMSACVLTLMKHNNRVRCC